MFTERVTLINRAAFLCTHSLGLQGQSWLPSWCTSSVPSSFIPVISSYFNSEFRSGVGSFQFKIKGVKCYVRINIILATMPPARMKGRQILQHLNSHREHIKSGRYRDGFMLIPCHSLISNSHIHKSVCYDRTPTGGNARILASHHCNNMLLPPAHHHEAIWDRLLSLLTLCNAWFTIGTPEQALPDSSATWPCCLTYPRRT